MMRGALHKELEVRSSDPRPMAHLGRTVRDRDGVIKKECRMHLFLLGMEEGYRNT